MAVVSMAVPFTAEAGEAAGTAGVGVVAVGADPDGAAAGVGAVPAGAAAVGIAAAGAGWWLGLGLGSGLGDRGGGCARRGRDRFAAGLWRRSGLLGQAARLDGERPLYGPAARERLLLSLKGARIRLQVKKN
jgi:hypothetical protein